MVFYMILILNFHAWVKFDICYEKCYFSRRAGYKDNLDEFLKRNFYSEVIKHSQRLFIQGNYFHAVFKSA